MKHFLGNKLCAALNFCNFWGIQLFLHPDDVKWVATAMNKQGVQCTLGLHGSKCFAEMLKGAM